MTRGKTHLLIGSPFDACCLAVHRQLEERGLPVCILSNPFTDPPHFSWRVDGLGPASRLTLKDGRTLSGDDVAGVLVRGTAWFESDGWQSNDLLYMHAETQAALLGWLWSLWCPIVNRYPPLLWYLPRPALVFWQPFLFRCGLTSARALVTNVSHEARNFGEHHGMKVVYAPLTTATRYLVSTDQDWSGLAAMQRCAPVCLMEPHGAVHTACVVGDSIVWEGPPPPARRKVEVRLRHFAAATGLGFVEVVLAMAGEGLRVVAVEPQPHFERFGQTAQRAIVDGLVRLLASGEGDHPTRAASPASNVTEQPMGRYQ